MRTFTSLFHTKNNLQFAHLHIFAVFPWIVTEYFVSLQVLQPPHVTVTFGKTQPLVWVNPTVSRSKPKVWSE